MDGQFGTSHQEKGPVGSREEGTENWGCVPLNQVKKGVTKVDEEV